jgi:hypothetical protein
MKPGGSSLAITMLAALCLTTPAFGRTRPGTAVQAIITSKSGEFHRCYKQFVAFGTTCTVHHVHLPEHIAIGDYIKLEYGSNPKHYAFHVGRIARAEDGGCTVRSDSGGPGGTEKIKIDFCQPDSK